MIKRLINGLFFKLGYLRKEEVQASIDSYLNKNSLLDLKKAYETKDWEMIYYMIRKDEVLENLILNMEKSLLYGKLSHNR